MLEKLGNLTKEAMDFRREITDKHKDMTQSDRIEAYLVDILCVLNMEFQIRPRYEGDT